MKEPVESRVPSSGSRAIEMLQQNSAIIDQGRDGAARVFFVTDRIGVFDEMRAFPSNRAARKVR